MLPREVPLEVPLELQLQDPDVEDPDVEDPLEGTLDISPPMVREFLL